jgi:hypothetical protein
MTSLEDLETKHNFTFPLLYKTLFENNMLNWMRGFSTLEEKQTWAKDVYPTLKLNPPLLLHSGGSDFELLTAEEILDFTFPKEWDTKKHHFIPFAKDAEGNTYAFYHNNESHIVLIWQDDEAEYIAKNFEDFIFRKMLEATDDIDKDDIHADYGKDSPIELYRTDLLLDLKSITPYLNDNYVDVLTSIYNAEPVDMLFSYALKSENKLSDILKEHIDFELMGEAFDHEEQ